MVYLLCVETIQTDRYSVAYTRIYILKNPIYEYDTCWNNNNNKINHKILAFIYAIEVKETKQNLFKQKKSQHTVLSFLSSSTNMLIYQKHEEIMSGKRKNTNPNKLKE